MTKTAAILGAVNAVLALLLAFGFDVTAEQQAAITGIVNAALVLGAAVFDPKVPFGSKPLPSTESDGEIETLSRNVGG